MKIFFLSHCPPLPSWGGSMTFFRHFVERSDFETLVATTSHHVDEHELPYEPLRFGLPKLWSRLLRSRLRPVLYGLQSLYGGSLLPKSVMKAAREFQPDAVFTVAGNWDWTTLAAEKVARKLGVPLIASFNDWFDYGAFPAHPRFRAPVEKRFRRFYREADLALCTSDGMREALGEHSNAHVWYPTGAPVLDVEEPYQSVKATRERPLTVLFAGSLGEWYGPMMESIVTQCANLKSAIRFQIFGALQSWSDAFDHQATEEGTFGGRISFDELRVKASEADLLILPMGFGKDCAQVERTSFKTKFLDYLSFRRPILVWGPEYCSAVRVAREFDSGECVTDESAEVCAQAIARLAGDPERRSELIENASAMYQDRFRPDRIHSGLVEKIEELITNHS